MLDFDRITHDPDVMGGQACIRGMRVTVSLVFNLVASGMSIDEIMEAYPYLAAEDIDQALRYAASLPEEPARSSSRPFGLCAGEFTIPDDFDDPLPEHVLREFEGAEQDDSSSARSST